ncbi:MAG: hypothetical protein AAGC55_14245 [Myxococcota bacterium]
MATGGRGSLAVVGKHPELSAAAQSLPLSMFSRLYERLARFEGDVIPFQIGDTHVPPPEQARLGAVRDSWGRSSRKQTL